ncbi:MAG: hypothetical protein E6J52_10775 [Chloroflexi bacterium]|nr:MAG: hypothetical protein E6J52_10775 [Chloroflexota bacterium]
MVRQLRRMGIRDPRVLTAMARVPREELVREEDRPVAYGDHALPIGERVVHDDASLGFPQEAPYDRIIVTAATPRIDPALAAQLTDDGLLVAPIGDEEMQELVVRDAHGHEQRHGAVRFVPLRGRAGFKQ